MRWLVLCGLMFAGWVLIWSFFGVTHPTYQKGCGAPGVSRPFISPFDCTRLRGRSFVGSIGFDREIDDLRWMGIEGAELPGLGFVVAELRPDVVVVVGEVQELVVSATAGDVGDDGVGEVVVELDDGAFQGLVVRVGDRSRQAALGRLREGQRSAAAEGEGDCNRDACAG